MKYLFFLVLFIPVISVSQTHIQGVITDSKTNKPLPFASITTNTNFGTLSDIEGKFRIITKSPFTSITISYVGYKTVSIHIQPIDTYLKIKLKTYVENLNEVLITAKENPALQIIRNAISAKSENNIEKSLNSFKFSSYNKILVTANPDSISGKVDSIFILKNDTKIFHKLDSSNYKFKKEIDKQHIYISEKVSEFQFQKGKKKKEVVLASRMAGLKQPVYELLAITFQDFSFYNEHYTIAGTKYVNPIAKNALKHYRYKILDTVIVENRPSILIYFKPKEKKEIKGLEGVLYLDTHSYAITKAMAELKGIVNVKAIQNYHYLESFKSWFPTNRNIILKKGDNRDPISLFGGTLQFVSRKENDTIVRTSKKNPSDITYFISKSVNSNIEINVPVKVKKSSSTIQFSDNAHNQPQEFWNSYRTDSLTKRGENAYNSLDSIAESEGVERKIHLVRNLLKGYYPTKYVNLNLGKIINLNNYEGLRVGFGGETNSNFSKTLKFDSYVAYGTKDKDFKYRIGLSTRLNKETNTWLGAHFTNDLKEAAATEFILQNTSFSPINPRNLNISKFYNYKVVSTFLNCDIQPNLESKIQFSSGNYTPVFNYQYISAGKNLSVYTLTTASVGLQYEPKSEYMNSPVGKLQIKNGYPKITFQFTKSFENIFHSDFDFTRISFKISHRIKRLRRATTNILMEGGIVFGEAPISHLFNSTPNYTFKNPWVKRVTFAGKNSFETMGYNEFISDRFLAIHLKHELKPINISSTFKPQITFVTRAAIGNVDNPLYHNGLIFRSLQKGYLESGIEFNGLFKGFGLSTFYRYGAYKNPEWSDNLALKLTYKIRLGF